MPPTMTKWSYFFISIASLTGQRSSRSAVREMQLHVHPGTMELQSVMFGPEGNMNQYFPVMPGTRTPANLVCT